MDQPFVMSTRDARALAHPRRATLIESEDDAGPWPDLGVSIPVMKPGQPSCRSHSEPVQEDLLAPHGECLVMLDGEERRLRQWDFARCPAGAEHVSVG